ncbi:hypothetical protein JAAARDRAFT_189284 [Jaapia argillacea MUCL 33604]|uniref:Protein CPL1-like domain-containing protein n=1 Tax=Jaapia argillacea MUCL 33604 TaxID=933084 RepID=A0A067Q9U6_9AGAM|nr:hypothetical protein JAAARDRAFT_189284 [Jaapia argillacea MUCL 33604]
MTLFTRLGSALVLAAALLPLTGATTNNCKSDEFWYDNKGCCLKTGGDGKPPSSPPAGNTCPTNNEKWYWSGDKSCCVPSYPPPAGNTPSCPDKTSWDHDKGSCCDKGGNTPPPSPPSPPSNSCKSSEFWWSDKSCCLPKGGPSNPPSPPPGSDCPSDWSWHSGNNCCAPHNPPTGGTPSCKPSWGWSGGDFCCHPKPQPSGHSKRNHKSRSGGLCPTGLEACPISGLTSRSGDGSFDYECLDTTQELESCGGCVSLGKGQDCTAITGAWNVGCEQGSCVVYTCAAGYKRSANGQSCVAL